jgi:hypothetical protein
LVRPEALQERCIEEEERQRRCHFKAHGDVRLFLCLDRTRTRGMRSPIGGALGL